MARSPSKASTDGKDQFFRETVEVMTSDLEEIRMVTKHDFRDKVSTLLTKRKAPMLLLHSDELAGLQRLPRYDEVEDKLVDYGQIREEDVVVVSSHRWWRSSSPDGDQNEKVKLLLAKLPMIRDSLGLVDSASIYVWWDYFSIRQKKANIHKVEKDAQILSIPLYLAVADAVIAFRGGDEEAYTKGKKDPGHKGFYDNRVWTMVELYGFTSNYAMETSQRRGRQRYLAEVLLDYSAEERCLVEKVTMPDRLDNVRALLHDSLEWSLPPVTNLTDLGDLTFIEPMLIALASNSAQDRLHAACRFGLIHAARAFLELGQCPNFFDKAGFTPLMVCCNRSKPDILKVLLTQGANVNAQHPKIGVTALHQAVAFRENECARCLIAAGANLSLKDKKGRTALHVAACYSLDHSTSSYSVAQRDAGRDMLEMLLKHGVDPCIPDASGRTALHLAEDKGNSAIVDTIKAFMNKNQLARCMRPPSRLHSYEVEPVTFTALREHGVWSSSERPERTAKLPFIKFSPRSGIRNGPKIIIQETWIANDHEEAELYVSSLNATVWLLFWDVEDLDCPTMQDEVKDRAEFIESVCGPVDCTICWCTPGEIYMRLAVSRPDLVKSLILVSTCAILCEGGVSCGLKGAMQALLADPPAVNVDQILPYLVNKAFQQTPQFNAANDRWRDFYVKSIAAARKALSQGRDPISATWAYLQVRQGERPWGHWSDVTQPVLVIAGTDDAYFTAGQEYLAASVPNAEIEYVQGVSHVPMIEAPQHYRNVVLNFLRQKCMPVASGLKDSTSAIDTPWGQMIFDDEVVNPPEQEVIETETCCQCICGKTSATVSKAESPCERVVALPALAASPGLVDL